MDPLSAILFFILGLAVAGLYARHYQNTNRLTAHDAQLNRLVSDAESEKGTRRRVNHDFENRLRIAEGRPSLPPLPNDSQTSQD